MSRRNLAVTGGVVVGLVASVCATLAAAPAAARRPATAVAATTTASTAASEGSEGVLDVRRVVGRARAGHRGVPRVGDGGGLDHPLKPSECIARFGSACYGASQLRRLYGFDRLGPHADGRGVTTAIIMPYHNPTLRTAMRRFARGSGLADPGRRLRVIQRGKVPTADPAKPEQAVYPQEGLLDLQAALTGAPGQRLVYVEVDPGMLDSPATFGGVWEVLDWVTRRYRVDVASFSFGWFERNYIEQAGDPVKAAAVIRAQHRVLARVVRRGTTVLAATGDTGPTGPTLDGTKVYPEATVPVPAAVPAVTAVSGTELHADDHGTRTAPDTVWAEHGDGVATGGGTSLIYRRPRYQRRVAAVTGGWRGVGDIAAVGSVKSRVWMYTDTYQVLGGQNPGWVRAAGTSVSAPLVAGAVAVAAQRAGHRLGNINPRLYTMAATPASRRAFGIADVVTGCNTAGGVRGYCATPGFDLAGPWTIGNAARFVHGLARST